MRAPGIDAFAAPVGQRGHPALTEQRGQPAGQVAADHVAVLRIARPARHQLRQDRGAPGEPALQRVLQIEQAQVVLAALADDDARRGLGVGIGGKRARAFAAKLALQRLGVGRDPHSPARLLGPHRGGGEVAERLADPGPGLRQQQVRGLVARARTEHLRRAARIVALAGALFGIGVEQRGQPRGNRAVIEHDLRGLGAFGRFLPFGQAGEQPALGARGALDRGGQHARPGPAQPGERLQLAPRALALGPVGS